MQTGSRPVMSFGLLHKSKSIPIFTTEQKQKWGWEKQPIAVKFWGKGTTLKTMYEINLAKELTANRFPVWLNKNFDGIQGSLDYVGIIPVFGDAIDAFNGALYLARGKPGDAAVSFGAIFFFGATGPRMASNVVEVSIRSTDEVLADAGRVFGDDIIEASNSLIITTRSTTPEFVHTAAQAALGNVIRNDWIGTLQTAQVAARRGDEILPGLFMYGGHADIPGYQLHHIWPQALGGPLQGWGVYARGPVAGTTHTLTGGIQQGLDVYLRRVLNPTGQGLMPLDAMRRFARGNPEQVLPHIREFYRTNYPDIPFPY